MLILICTNPLSQRKDSVCHIWMWKLTRFKKVDFLTFTTRWRFVFSLTRCITSSELWVCGDMMWPHKITVYAMLMPCRTQNITNNFVVKLWYFEIILTPFFCSFHPIDCLWKRDTGHILYWKFWPEATSPNVLTTTWGKHSEELHSSSVETTNNINFCMSMPI